MLIPNVAGIPHRAQHWSSSAAEFHAALKRTNWWLRWLQRNCCATHSANSFLLGSSSGRLLCWTDYGPENQTFSNEGQLSQPAKESPNGQGFLQSGCIFEISNGQNSSVCTYPKTGNDCIQNPNFLNRINTILILEISVQQGSAAKMFQFDKLN